MRVDGQAVADVTSHPPFNGSLAGMAGYFDWQHNLLATPAQADLADPALEPVLRHYLRGADETSAEERARLFRAAWDLAGSAHGGRVDLYERFYLASAPRDYTLAHLAAQRNREWEAVPAFWEATDESAARYGLDDPGPRK